MSNPTRSGRLMKRESGRQGQAFTLIELIGVLAAVTILTALLVPKVFEAINNGRVANTVDSYQTIKQVVVKHFGNFGSLASINGTLWTGRRWARINLAITIFWGE